nr:hypothetical protein [Lachnospiraceae bacterium]
HYMYSPLLRINVLYLNRTELATKEDKAYKLDYWAKLFRSNTWEELQKLASEDPIGEEVAEVMYQATIQSEEKTLFEAHQRYLYNLRAAENGGYDKGHEAGLEQGLEQGLERGRDLHIIELVCKKLSRGLAPDQIAVELEEDPARVSAICEIAKKHLPDYNANAILDELRN